MLARWVTARMSLVITLVCALALVSIPSLMALAGDDARVSGKRVTRKGNNVVTVDLTKDDDDDDDDDDEEDEAQAAARPRPRPTSSSTPAPTSTPTPTTTPTTATTPSGATATAPVGPALPSAPSGPCNGTRVPAGSNLASVVSSAPAGATLCLDAGRAAVSSPIRPKSGQRFIGAGMDATSIEGSGVSAVFDAKGVSNVTWQHLAISGAAGSESCKPACGRGISGGAGSRIDHVYIHHNANAGIDGTDGSVVITNSELAFNGSDAFTGCCAAGIKSANGYTISNSYIHDNVGVGVWCDVGCTGIPFQVLDNRIENNLLGGVRFEISSGPTVIRGNTVRNNNRAGQGGHGGIEINSSQNATVENNVLGGNQGAGIIANGSRGPLGNVVIRNNQLGGDKVSGCGGGVSCA
jgi:hypothetical protein